MSDGAATGYPTSALVMWPRALSGAPALGFYAAAASNTLDAAGAPADEGGLMWPAFNLGTARLGGVSPRRY